LRHPAEAQSNVLSRLLREHAASAFGRAHGFGEIHSYDEFVRRVPPADYGELSPWVERVFRGENGVLSSDPVTHLIPTSGATAARKLIPFTRGLQRDFNAAIGPWMLDLLSRHPGMAFGPAYWSVTPAAQAEVPQEQACAVPIGFEDDARYVGGTRARLVETVLAVPAALRSAPDLETFRYLTLLCLLRRRDLRFISVWHPTFLSLLVAVGDIGRGGCRRADALPASLCERLRFRPSLPRARELARVGPEELQSIWPELRLISCWGDGHAELALEELRQRFPGVRIQPKGLLATEAVVTIPFGGRHPVAVCSHFFEFIDAAGALHRVHELREGECYDVVVSTGGGLWRYRLGDGVEVTGFSDATPSLRFVGRTGNVSDRRGEKLSEPFVALAIREVAATLCCPPRFAMVAPEEEGEREGTGCAYTLFVEGDIRGDESGRLDAILRRNPQYACCRDLGQLGEMRLFQIREGGYETFVNEEMKRGRRLGEIKPCALSGRSGWARCFAGEHLPARASELSPN